VKGRVRAAVDAYEKFDTLRDVTFVSLAPNMHHYICGGISWGDSPTESFDSFRTLGTFSAVWDLLEKWAKADSLKAGRLYERFQRWCEQHADDIDAVRYGSASLYGRIISVIESTGAFVPEEIRDQLDQIAQTIVDENKEPEGDAMSNDPTEAVRRQLVQEINSNPGSREALEAKYGQAWDTEQLGQDFVVQGFLAPFVVVKRKADGALGTLEFQHAPRFYYNFQPD
jgi:hypothetical protein